MLLNSTNADGAGSREHEEDAGTDGQNRQTQDPQVRQKLLNENWATMQSNMQMIMVRAAQA